MDVVCYNCKRGFASGAFLVHTDEGLFCPACKSPMFGLTEAVEARIRTLLPMNYTYQGYSKREALPIRLANAVPQERQEEAPEADEPDEVSHTEDAAPFIF